MLAVASVSLSPGEAKPGVQLILSLTHLALKASAHWGANENRAQRLWMAVVGEQRHGMGGKEEGEGREGVPREPQVKGKGGP